MPRYFFHLVRNAEALLDEQGAELPDAATAERVAGDVIRDLEFQSLDVGAVEDWRLEIIDSKGKPVACLPLAGKIGW